MTNLPWDRRYLEGGIIQSELAPGNAAVAAKVIKQLPLKSDVEMDDCSRCCCCVSAEEQ
jgi:hypothetical protein